VVAAKSLSRDEVAQDVEAISLIDDQHVPAENKLQA
jgi:hypothetical protein